MVKDATKVRLLTGAGLIDAKVVQVDAANDLALLKADGKFSPLPISSSRSAQLGGTVATVGFPDIVLQGFAPKVLAHGHHGGIAGGKSNFDRGMTRGIFKSARSLQTATMQPGKWQDEHRPLVDERGNVIGIVSAEILADGHQLNYAVKVGRRCRAAGRAAARPYHRSGVVKSAQDAAVLVPVY